MKSQRFHCPDCGRFMANVEDYVGGGSHYWVLRCKVHGRYTASSYSYREFIGWIPRRWPE